MVLKEVGHTRDRVPLVTVIASILDLQVHGLSSVRLAAERASRSRE